MRTTIFIFSIIFALLSTSCTPSVQEDDKSEYMYPEFPFETLPVRFNEETAETLDFPFRLYPYAVDEEGDPCWHYYYHPGTDAGSHSGYIVYFSMLIKEDSTPDFDNYMVLTFNSGERPGQFPADYTNYLWYHSEISRTIILPQPEFNTYNDELFEEGYIWEFCLPIVFYDLDKPKTVELGFYHTAEQKWYVTKEYRITFGEDLIDGESPIIGGKVTMECLE